MTLTLTYLGHAGMALDHVERWTVDHLAECVAAV